MIRNLNHNTPDFTEKQVDELLSQKREITGFVQKDKIRESRDARFYLVVVVVFVLALSGLVLWKNPNSFDEVLDFLAGLLGGGFGGYGLGIRKRS